MKLSRQRITKQGNQSWRSAERHGIDTSLLKANLLRTPLERILRHEQARQAFLALRNAGRALHVRKPG